MIAAGALRHRVTIEQVTETQDTFGATVVTWSPFAVRWSALEPLTGREFFQAQQVNAEVSHTLRCRHIAGVTPKMRVRLGARLFDIAAVRNLEERNEELELLAVERL